MANFDWMLELEEREANPTAFALTVTEARYVVRASWIQTNVLRQYLDISDEERRKPAVQAKIREDIFTAFKNKRVSTTRLVKLAERVRSGLYWSYSIVSIDADADITTYEIASNIEGLRSSFDTVTFASFFDTEDVRERARLIGVPDEALYLPTIEFHSLQALYRLCRGHGDIQPAQGKGDYWQIKSSPILDVLGEIGTTALIERELIEGFKNEYRITAANGVTITIDANAYEDLEQLLKTPNADKLMIQFNYKAVERGLTSKTVELSLDEVMEERGLKDRKEAAKAVRAAVNLLYAVSVNIEDKATGSFKKSRIAQEATYTAGTGRKAVATITYTDGYFKHLQTTQQFLQYPRKLQLIPNNRANAYIFGRAFANQQRRNIGKPNNIENKLSVRTLLRRSNLPTYSKLKDKGQASQLIIRPFLDAMDYLEEDLQLFTYHFQYAKSGGKAVELTDADLDKLYGDYSLFSSLMVEVVWNDTADYEHLLERKRVQHERAEARQSKPKRGRPKKT